jgi:hypothetical protein
VNYWRGRLFVCLNVNLLKVKVWQVRLPGVCKKCSISYKLLERERERERGLRAVLHEGEKVE